MTQKKKVRLWCVISSLASHCGWRNWKKRNLCSQLTLTLKSDGVTGHVIDSCFAPTRSCGPYIIQGWKSIFSLKLSSSLVDFVLYKKWLLDYNVLTAPPLPSLSGEENFQVHAWRKYKCTQIFSRNPRVKETTSDIRHSFAYNMKPYLDSVWGCELGLSVPGAV